MFNLKAEEVALNTQTVNDNTLVILERATDVEDSKIEVEANKNIILSQAETVDSSILRILFLIKQLLMDTDKR